MVSAWLGGQAARAAPCAVESVLCVTYRAIACLFTFSSQFPLTCQEVEGCHLAPLKLELYRIELGVSSFPLAVKQGH